MVAQTLEDIIITDKEISGYMETRDTGEHLKIKKPSQYFEDVKKHFREDLTGGLSLPFINTENDFKVRMRDNCSHRFFRTRKICMAQSSNIASNEKREDYDCFF